MADLTQWDRSFYRQFIKDELPEHICDTHVHIWRKAHRAKSKGENETAGWVHNYCMENDLPYSELQKLYADLLPGKTVYSLLFGWVESDVDVGAMNRYVGAQLKKASHLKGLAVCKPEYSPEETAREVEGNGLIGLKPYPTFVRAMPAADIRVTDMVTRDQLVLANERGWVILLHLPRPKRLADWANIEDILMIEKEYPNVRLIVAHIGRAYCLENIGDAFEALKKTQNVMFDMSGNTNQAVFEKTLDTFGPERVMFGSDLPISAMKLKREHMGGTYINIVPAGSMEDISDDPHIREADGNEAKAITFFLYESMGAMIRAAKKIGLNEKDVERIFYRNAIGFIGF